MIPERELKKILFVIDSFGPSGSERSVSELLPCLKKFNVECVVVCLKKKQNQIEQDLQRQGFEIRILSGKNRISRIRNLRRMLLKESPDIIHTTLFESNLIGRLACWGLAFPIISSIVDTSYDAVRYKNPRLKSGRLRMVQKIDSWTSRHLTTHFHAVSEAAKKSAVRELRLNEDRITVVLRGREAKRLGTPGPQRRDEARTKLGILRGPVIVNVGRQEYKKGQKYLLEAIPPLLPKHPDLKVLISGREGHDSKDLRELQEKLKLNDSVTFLGHRDDVPEILAAADLFVFPSLYEGLPGAVVEAMALGLPVVASDIPPIREVVEPGKNALLVPPGSIQELSEAMDQLLTNRKLAQLFGMRSRQIFEQRFTLENSASCMIG
ncbi:glycosyltransferase family 4 protein, partial [bacterium]|nr:glycosyltransferase family 4 protein [bacterium]